jgi:hypothetical protein
MRISARQVRRSACRFPRIRTDHLAIAASGGRRHSGHRVTTHYAVLQVAFAAFVITQLTWQINAWLDVRLNRPPRSRKRWRIQITLTRTPVRPKPRP